MKILQVMIVLLLLGMMGCRSPHSSDFPGTWMMNEGSRKVLPEALQNAAAKIEFDRDGSFIASNLPGLFFSPGGRDARLESGSGTWTLVTHEDYDQVQLDFRAIADWKSEVPYGTQLNISTGWSGITLSYFVGDADEGVRVDLEKK